MTCITLIGTNNPGNGVHVDRDGKLEVHAVSLQEQSSAGEKGELFNFGSGIVTISDEVDTPMFYLKNTGENRNIKITKIITTFGPSVNGSGQPIIVKLHKNIISGTILDEPNIPPVNFNVGSGNTITIDSKVGAGGLTMVSETEVPILIPSDSRREEIDTDSIILPRGRSVGVSLQAGAGNTNMLASISINLYLQDEDN